MAVLAGVVATNGWVAANDLSHFSAHAAQLTPKRVLLPLLARQHPALRGD